MKYSHIYKKGNLFLHLIFFIYAISIFIKKVFIFQDGLVDLFILFVIFLLLLFRPYKFLLAFKLLSVKKIFILFVIFGLYYICLSFVSYNTFYLKILEFFSIFKWLIYFFMGYMFSYIYLTRYTNFPLLFDFLILSLTILIYSFVFYNWSGIGSFHNLFGFYDNSFESIFSLRSVFALFGFVVFIYSINSFLKYRFFSLLLLISSAFFIFMSGNRKILLGVAILIFLLKIRNRYKYIINIIKILVIIIAIIVITHTSLYKKSIDEYSNPSQPRIFAYTKSFQIAYDYFPFGPGPSTCFSKGSMINYSPIYYEYGMDQKWGFGPNDEIHFYNDTYWAQIIGQYGAIGFLLILLIYFSLIKMVSATYDYYQIITYPLILYTLLFLSLTTPLFQRTEISLLLFFGMGIYAQKSEIQGKLLQWKIKPSSK